MEEIEHILRDFGLILGAGLVSQLIATVTRLPQMVVLVVVAQSKHLHVPDHQAHDEGREVGRPA